MTNMDKVKKPNASADTRPETLNQGDSRRAFWEAVNFPDGRPSLRPTSVTRQKAESLPATKKTKSPKHRRFHRGGHAPTAIRNGAI